MRAPCWGTMTCEKKPNVPRVRVLLGALALFSLLPGCRWQRVTAQPGAAAGIRFLDATGAAGIHFRHTHGGFGKKLLPETVGSGVAWLDYDGDGWQDLIFVNCKPIPGARTAARPMAALYRNRGDGTFEDRTAGSGFDAPMYGQSVSAADYDGDGHVDVLITCLGPNHLFHNNGNGTFTDVTTQAGLGEDRNPWRYHAGSAWLDYDH